MLTFYLAWFILAARPVRHHLLRVVHLRQSLGIVGVLLQLPHGVQSPRHDGADVHDGGRHLVKHLVRVFGDGLGHVAARVSHGGERGGGKREGQRGL